MFTLAFYKDAQGHEPVLDWLRRLPPRKRRAIGVAMFEILQHDQSEISTLESGQANPTYRTLQTLAAALGGRIDLVIG